MTFTTKTASTPTIMLPPSPSPLPKVHPRSDTYLPLVRNAETTGDGLVASSQPNTTLAPSATFVATPLSRPTPPIAVPVSPAPPPTDVPASPAPPTDVPALPTPQPTPTPRVKQAGKYTSLQDYPRPANDSGFGFHITGEPHVPKKDKLDAEIIPKLKALGATWVTVWASSDLDEEILGAKTLVDAGFEVIVRYHEMSKPPHPDWVPSLDTIKKYRAVGVNYFVTGNEPNLTIENPSKGNADLIAKQWIISSDMIKSTGGVPLLYPMSPGGDGDVANSRVMLVGILDYLKSHDALDTLDGAGVAIHNRPMGKPLDVRDSTSFLEYEWIDDTVASYAGKHLPLFGTEAGFAFGEQVLPIYPKVDGELHRQYNMAIITGFRDARWRDTLFTQTFWLLSGFGYKQFIADWWIANPLNYGKDLPIVQALMDLPKFTRKFQQSGFDTRK